ncbi:DUF58 domain-containing protein [Pedobacter faecalis]|uniref:DUF58 domain-containing protein n=1 Tax=Pedobacter faecalis TaxID=3041495 RepID=UPI00254D45E0|nr:DUF58 domain-containing protein [Pedobacter sp. ELA7]
MRVQLKEIFIRYYQDLFLSRRLYAGIACTAMLFLLTFFLPALSRLPELLFLVFIILIAADFILLYAQRKTIFVVRELPERLSNGDENELSIYLENFYTFRVKVGIIDEIPAQFQKRDLWFETILTAGEKKHIQYLLRPTSRGEYVFGRVRLFLRSPLGLIVRRFNFGEDTAVAVYPSFLHLRKYELMAISDRLSEIGIKKIRRVGHSLEFDQTRTYVKGDDYRTVNWKATARRGELMVNTYTDEKAQHVYCLIDKSRSMKMPFEGMTLLDYAINASLVLSSVAMVKQDRAGLITVAEQSGSVLAADRKPVQLGKIMAMLYREQTRYLELNIEALYTNVRQTIKQRSLLIFFTNFESMSSLKRQLPYLQRLARHHLLLVVFFENTELHQLIMDPASTVEDIYIQTIAEKFAYEKKLMVMELARHGILSILTQPKNLTVNVVNRYLEVKARQRI